MTSASRDLCKGDYTDGMAIIKSTGRLTLKSLPATLPLMILMILMGYFMRYGRPYLPATYPTLHQQISVVLFILYFPLCGAVFKIMDTIAKGLQDMKKSIGAADGLP